MLVLELEDDERRLLMRVIEERLCDLHEEVRYGEHGDLNNALWNEENALKRLRERLRPISLAYDALARVN
jgi:hypothetical protein